MTYIPVNRILVHIPNKFEAIKVAALECRRLNEQLQATEGIDDHEEKITTMAVRRLMDGHVHYHDARERREQERSEAMLAAAEEMLDMTAPTTETLAELGVVIEEPVEVEVSKPAVKAPVEEDEEVEIEDDGDDDDEMVMEADDDEVLEEIEEEPQD
jgi:DNA-directed RNA polymerase subunit K/omega